MKPYYQDRLQKQDYCVTNIPIELARNIVRQYHYTHGSSNTAVYTHGLFLKSDILTCLGIAWWLPPTKAAALKSYPQNWQGVLSLSRLVILPDVPKNACTFLLGQSRKMIDREKWPCLITYADTWQGHSGTIYKADNWVYVGETKPSPVWVKNGRVVARKAGPFSRTKEQMEALGCQLIGMYSKHKYIRIDQTVSDVIKQPSPSYEINFENIINEKSKQGILMS